MANRSPGKSPNRRRVLRYLAAAGIPGTGLLSYLLVGDNRYYSGPISDHFDGVRFFNHSRAKPKGVTDLLRWNFVEPSAKWPKHFPSPFADQPPAEVDADTVRVSHIGHASFLIQTGGHAILIDPVYADRASPFSFAGPRRVNAPGIAFDALPKIDTVIVTHNHYDHMDMPALGRLWQQHQPRFLTPLGNDTLLRQGIPNVSVTAMDWHQHIQLSDRVRIDAVPTQHWSARGAFDRMHALWASFILQLGAHRIYAVGDKGFGDGSIFRNVRTLFPDIDLALLPIGAFEPRWMMRDQHMNPLEAVEALALCGAKRAIGHHWGTFQLTNESIEQPATALAAALEERDLPPARFMPVQPGQVVTIA